MEFLRTTLSLGIASVLTACASGPNIADKEDSSIALQITTSAGSHKIFHDSSVRKDQVGDVGLTGYVGSTLLGWQLGSAMTGFGLALLADSTHGWEYTNFITYLDAREVSGLDKAQICEIVANKMSDSISTNKDVLQTYTNIQLNDSNRLMPREAHYNGGSYICADGYKVSDSDSIENRIYFRNDNYVVGSVINISSVQKPVSSELFSKDLQAKLPSDEVVVVRFNFNSSFISHLLTEHQPKEGYFSSDGFIMSPRITLPPATFISLPRKQYIRKGEYLPLVSMVRDNDNAYLFIKPESYSQQSISLTDYHEQISSTYSEIIKAE